MNDFQRQRGSVLVVSLVILVVMTLLVLSSARSSVANLSIVGNSQARKSLESSALQAIEQVIGNVANFETPTTQTLTVNNYAVTVTAPTCLSRAPASGYSALFALSPDDTNWEFQANATDPATGASVVMRQGVKVRLNAGSCP